MRACERGARERARAPTRGQAVQRTEGDCTVLGAGSAPYPDPSWAQEAAEAGQAGGLSASVSDAEEENGAAATLRRGGAAERARYIPLRLSQDERRTLRLLEAALSVSEYTDKARRLALTLEPGAPRAASLRPRRRRRAVRTPLPAPPPPHSTPTTKSVQERAPGAARAQVDIASWKSKAARVHAQVKDLCAILCALVVAQDYRRGQALVQHRSFRDNAAFFQARPGHFFFPCFVCCSDMKRCQGAARPGARGRPAPGGAGARRAGADVPWRAAQDAFEVGRRYKIQNPHKMRSEYGKLMYLLMDRRAPWAPPPPPRPPSRGPCSQLRRPLGRLVARGVRGELTGPHTRARSAEPAIQELLEFRCVRPLRTVWQLLQEAHGTAMLSGARPGSALARLRPARLSPACAAVAYDAVEPYPRPRGAARAGSRSTGAAGARSRGRAAQTRWWSGRRARSWRARGRGTKCSATSA